jgi:hypothetical protein
MGKTIKQWVESAKGFFKLNFKIQVSLNYKLGHYGGDTYKVENLIGEKPISSDGCKKFKLKLGAGNTNNQNNPDSIELKFKKKVFPKELILHQRQEGGKLFL